MQLSLNETRVIGVLIEKETTTPDQYPMSLNALTNACNQKTNRDPVLSLSDTEVQNCLDALIKQGLVVETRVGNRTPKYKHRFCNSEFGELQFTKQELAIVCTLFLRGAQTPGELRTRTNRLCSFSDVQQTETVLNGLMEHARGPYVVKLPREPGKRESRYAHLLSGEVEQNDGYAQENEHATTLADIQAEGTPSAPQGEWVERIELLELTVEELQQQIEVLQNQIKALTN